MNPGVRALASLVEGLMASQWQPLPRLEAHQRERLHRLAEYAARHSALIRQRLTEAALTPAEMATPEGLTRMPLLRRRDLQLAAAQLYCAEVPPEHGPVHDLRTSGSTGEPVTVRRTVLTDLHWNALTMRDHLWHEIEFGGRFSAVRPTMTKHMRLPNWGPPTSLLFRTGAAEAIPVSAETRQQAEWLLEFSPQVLLSFPSVAEAIAGHLREGGRRLPELRRVKSIGETLSPRLREAIATGLGAPVVDIYSSHEVGIIAVQCPQSSLYHVMAENLIVEVLNAEGGPCAEGEAGRIAITDLHNYATPILRYEIGDWAEPGGPCPCGRGLPTLRRILGRERNLVKMP
ncbi:MAG TPA: AMP-binding protein, partial [Stellaceae bacterium]|nr:AMP-binding protein [Stellaceae bacterium]